MATFIPVLGSSKYLDHDRLNYPSAILFLDGNTLGDSSSSKSKFKSPCDDSKFKENSLLKHEQSLDTSDTTSYLLYGSSSSSTSFKSEKICKPIPINEKSQFSMSEFNSKSSTLNTRSSLSSSSSSSSSSSNTSESESKRSNHHYGDYDRLHNLHLHQHHVQKTLPSINDLSNAYEQQHHNQLMHQNESEFIESVNGTASGERPLNYPYYYNHTSEMDQTNLNNYASRSLSGATTSNNDNVSNIGMLPILYPNEVDAERYHEMSVAMNDPAENIKMSSFVGSSSSYLMHERESGDSKSNYLNGHEYQTTLNDLNVNHLSHNNNNSINDVNQYHSNNYYELLSQNLNEITNVEASHQMDGNHVANYYSALQQSAYDPTLYKN